MVLYRTTSDDIHPMDPKLSSQIQRETNTVALVTIIPIHPEKPPKKASTVPRLSTQALRVLHRDKANTASGCMDEHLE